MTTKIKIYAPDFIKAARLAADMNLALRHWEYVGPSTFARLDVWADFGTVMDELQTVEWAAEIFERNRRSQEQADLEGRIAEEES